MDEFGNLCGEGGARCGPSSCRRVHRGVHPAAEGFGVRASAHVRLHEVSDNEACAMVFVVATCACRLEAWHFCHDLPKDGTYTVTYSIPDWAQGPVKLEVADLECGSTRLENATICHTSLDTSGRYCWMAIQSEAPRSCRGL